MADYPLIASLVRSKPRFEQAVARAEAGVAQGVIANPVYQDAKSTVNAMLSESWRAALNAVYTHAGTWELPPEVHALRSEFGSDPTLHTVGLWLRKLDASKLSHPMVDAMRAHLTEATQLAGLFATLKPLVVKRQPKPVEDRRARYDAPSASRSGIAMVKQLLEATTDAAYADLKASLMRGMQRPLDAYLEAQRQARAEGRTLPLDAFYGTSRRSKAVQFSPFSNDLVRGLVVIGGPDAEVVARPDAAARIERAAIEHADAIRDNFVYKNLTKLDSIIETKGNFVRAETVGWKIEMSALRGSFRFHFADGSHFVVRNSVVWLSTMTGKPFNRFPLTFHDVVLPGGVKMGRPSEARMNAVFAHA